jgi:hypothetical protein
VAPENRLLSLPFARHFPLRYRPVSLRYAVCLYPLGVSRSGLPRKTISASPNPAFHPYSPALGTRMAPSGSTHQTNFPTGTEQRSPRTRRLLSKPIVNFDCTFHSKDRLSYRMALTKAVHRRSQRRLESRRCRARTRCKVSASTRSWISGRLWLMTLV